MPFFLALVALLGVANARLSHSHSRSSSSSSSSSDSESSEPVGACCFGDKAIGINYTQRECERHYVWAGPDTDAADCAGPKPCCYSDRCTDERCFSCIVNGGRNVRNCTRDCHPRTARNTTRPATTPAPTRARTGCCCINDGYESRRLTYEDCEREHGTYLGDGTECREASCARYCCAAHRRQCVPCHTPPRASERFIGYGSEVCDDADEPCGAACCVNAQLTEADSSATCRRLGGMPPSAALAGHGCGGGCCVNAQYSLAPNASECELDGGTYLGDNVGFQPGVCGGCCCTPEGAFPAANRAACVAIADSAYQGDGVPCPPGSGVARRRLRERRDDSSSDRGRRDSDSSRRRGGGDARTAGSSTESSSDFESRSWSIDSSSSSSSSDRSESGEYSASRSVVDTVSFDVCANDGCCCLSKHNNGHAEMVSDASECAFYGGVFKGEGTRCSTSDCAHGGVCCIGEQGAFVPVRKELECKLRNGYYVGDGSTIEMRGLCGQSTGACICAGPDSTPDDCVETPNATVCDAIGGFRFLGSWSRCEDVDCPAYRSEDAGACCVPAVAGGAHVCRVVESQARCASLAGVWNKRGSRCADNTCAAIVGRCCADGRCIGNQTAADCATLGGKWGGAESRCSDDNACDAGARGACCRAGHACATTSPDQCRADGGRFLGVNSTCHYHNGAACEACTPCFLNAPRCDAEHPCRNPAAMCSRDYGRCVVLALPDERDRLRCGARDTDGLPCLARPLFGNARVGVCVADGGDDDASCRRLVEFESGCRCAAAVVTEKKQCEVSLHGVVSARLSHSDERRGVANQQVELYRSSRATRDGKAQFDYVAHQLTGTGGHYAFAGLEPALYLVRLADLARCYRADSPHDRLVTPVCGGAVILHHLSHPIGDRTEERVNFELVYRCTDERAAEREAKRSVVAPPVAEAVRWLPLQRIPSHVSGEIRSVDSHHHGGGGEIDGDEGSWSWLWVLFWLVVLLLCCAGCIYCLHWREEHH